MLQILIGLGMVLAVVLTITVLGLSLHIIRHRNLKNIDWSDVFDEGGLALISLAFILLCFGALYFLGDVSMRLLKWN